MDFEESRPSSSASSSSSNSSNKSNKSHSSTENLKNVEEQHPPTSSPQLSLGRKSRSPSPSPSNKENYGERCSESKSNSNSCASSSSENENEDDFSQPKSKKSSPGGGSSSEDESIDQDDEHQNTQQRSPSPFDTQHSSGHSSSSSVSRSLSNSRTELDGDFEEAEAEAEVNIAHEDLSDVSDMESEKRVGSNNDSKPFSDNTQDIKTEGEVKETQDKPENNKLIDDQQGDSNIITDLRQKLDKKKELQGSEYGKENAVSNGNFSNVENCNSNSASQQIDALDKTHDEDALDFEAEEGECLDVSKENEIDKDMMKTTPKNGGDKSDGGIEEGEELEEGEVSDEEEKRPEETEPKPICRFYTRGQCTWGMSCRFLHPGVTDKGNYTMFDLVRPVPVNHSGPTPVRSASYASDYHDYRTERPTIHHRPAIPHFSAPTIFPSHHDSRTVVPETPVVVESAWERGLRTAKEMMRKASKRKEQDMDFEDKKMNLPISPEELEKESYYLKERASPPEIIPPYSRHAGGHDVHGGLYSVPERYGRNSLMPTYDDIDNYGRSARYRELPPHRMPQYEDERRVRPTREVIVQRVDPVGRADEWNDPWMRAKSPGGRAASSDHIDRRRRDRRSYSSNSSYSSSTSSQSDSSSDTSRSPSPSDHRRRYNSAQKSPIPVRRHGMQLARSPSSSLRQRRSPGSRRSPVAKRRGGYSSPSPTFDKRLAYSPVHKRRKLSPTPKQFHERSKTRRRHTSSSSGSDSSDSSESNSDSDSGSSSSDSSSKSGGKPSRNAARSIPGKIPIDKKLPRKVEPSKKRSPISIEIKKQSLMGSSALTSPTHSASSEKETKKSRREELLKQLRAVEDAIAKKRQKLA